MNCLIVIPAQAGIQEMGKSDFLLKERYFLFKNLCDISVLVWLNF